ncbi:MAG: hypothetical protein U0625_02535 [Phycisphaerales bacterium]
MPRPTRQTRAFRRAAALAVALAGTLAAGAGAQVTGAPITGDRLGGFVLPVEPGKWPLILKSTRAWTWKVDSTQRIYLSEKVNIQVGSYDFYADEAVVWIERIPSAKGLITQIAIWFPETSEPTKAAGLGASGTNLFVTASTTGETVLRSVLVDPTEPESNGTLRRAEARLQAYLLGLAAQPPALRSFPAVSRPPVPPPPPPLKVGDLAPADPSVAAAVEAATVEGSGSTRARKPRPGGPTAPPMPKAAPPGSGPVPALPAPLGEPPPPTPGDAPVRTGATPIVEPDSLVAFAAERIDIDARTDTIALTRGATLDVMPRAPGRSVRALQMHAERVVIFLVPGTLEKLRAGATEVDARDVAGIYLEGDVGATDFQYTVRAKRAYYDLAANRATMVEGVLRQQSRKGPPLVARATELRQYSQEQWQADKVLVSTSEFFEPHLAVGLERATITKTVDDEGAPTTVVQGSQVTLRTQGTPFFWMPGFESEGDINIPIRGIGVNYDQKTGAQIETRWDLYSLLGLKPPPKTDLTLSTLAYTNYGLGGGVKGKFYGANLDVLAIYDFQNLEQTSAGKDVRPGQEFRGLLSIDDTLHLTDSTALQLQGSYVSDESFMQVWRQKEFASKFQKETSAYLVSADERSEASLLLSVPTNAVITSGSQLAARPYQVQKYPEAAYKRMGDSLFGDSITWQQEYSANLMALRFGKGSENTTGVKNNTFNLLNQILPDGSVFTRDTSLQKLYESSGYADDAWTRIYTRQEIAMPFGEQGWKFTPFAAGNVYGYVNGNPGDYDSRADRLRFLVSAGFRSSADIVANYDTVEIAALDLHRLRHVFTPYLNGWAGWNSTPNGAYAIYDQEIEGATGGSVVQAGMRHKLQTMRGGPGNWQSVDWLTVDIGVMWNGGGDGFARTYTDGAKYRQSPFPQYFNWRPELSQWGRNAYGSFKLAASNSMYFSGSLVYLLDDDLPDFGSGAFGLSQGSRGSIGMTMEHSPDVSTFIEYRAINNYAPDTAYISDALLACGIDYKIGKTYKASFVPTWDLKENDFRLVSFNLAREMPDFTLLATFGYDAIQGQYFGGLNIRIGDTGGSAAPMPFINR